MIDFTSMVKVTSPDGEALGDVTLGKHINYQFTRIADPEQMKKICSERANVILEEAAPDLMLTDPFTGHLVPAKVIQDELRNMAAG